MLLTTSIVFLISVGAEIIQKMDYTDDEQDSDGSSVCLNYPASGTDFDFLTCKKCPKYGEANEIEAHMVQEHGKCVHCESFLQGTNQKEFMHKHIKQRHPKMIKESVTCKYCKNKF